MKKKFLQSLSSGRMNNVSDKKKVKTSNKSMDSDNFFFTIYEQILENSRDVLYCINYTGFHINYISPSVKDLTGYSLEEIMQMSTDELISIIHPDYLDIVLNHYKTIKNNQRHKNITLEYRIKPKRGISRWVSDNHMLLFDPKDNSEKIIGNIRDITDIKLVEDALKRSRDRLYMAIEATNDGMWDWHIHTNAMYFDMRFYTMLGYEPFEFKGSFNEWMKRIHPDDIKSVQNQLQKHLEGKSGQWNIEYRFKAKDDSWIWILNRGKIFDADENDTPLRMVGTHTDITFRKKAELTLKQKNEELTKIEEQLKNANQDLVKLNTELKQRNGELQNIYDQLQFNEEKFRQLAENTQDIFWLRDEQNILYINPSFEKIWGRKCEDVIKNPAILLEWIHPEDKLAFNTWIDIKTFENKTSYPEQYRIIKPNGEIRWLWVRLFPILDNNGKIYRMAGIASDITEHKKIEKALIDAKEKAMESDRLKSTFLANISHEIRTPMNGILGFTNLIAEKYAIDNTSKLYIDIINKSSNKLLRIIEDIVDISKIEANQLIINKNSVNLNTLINDIYYQFENEKEFIDKESLQLIIDNKTDISDPVIYTDEIRVKQIFNNLITNALKFTEKGFIKFGYKLLSSNTIEFYVQDTGIGIPAEVQPFIFQQFRQLNEHYSAKHGGTGIGLAICEGLVKLLDGHIWFDSDISKGTTFYFTLPYVKTVKTNTPHTNDFVELDNIDWSGKIILVVEDDIVNQEFFRLILTETNAEIITAETGEEAVNICRNNKNIDLVLMDIRLTQMDGYEALKQIREFNPDLKIIAQTAYALAEDEIRCMENGFTDYIPKPIKSKHLLWMINKHLSKKI